MVLDFGSGATELKPCVKALVCYEQEFDRDMVADLFGTETVRVPEDGEGVLFSFDYTQFEWTAMTRALWACARAADPAFPGYMEWVDALGDIDLMKVAAEFVPAVRDALFHSAPTEAEPEEGKAGK